MKNSNDAIYSNVTMSKSNYGMFRFCLNYEHINKVLDGMFCPV